MADKRAVLVRHPGAGFVPIKQTAVYCRISTRKNRQARSIENQISGLVSYVESRVELRLAGVYTDIGSGRTADTRSELKRLISDCMAGKIGYVVTKSMSRFGRNTADTLSICRRLKEKNIDVYFINEGIHSIDSNGELSLTLTAAIAEGESYNKSESIKWGINKRAKDDNASIFYRSCYGYTLDENGELTILDGEAEVVKRIFESYLSGMGSHAIKKSLENDGIFSPTGKETWPKRTIEKILRKLRTTDFIRCMR